MLTHGQIWDGIDNLAREHGHTPSGLARIAGLDPTTFNKSKRKAANGKLRWPSTESIAKVLEATGTTLDDFAGFVDGADERPAPRSHSIPVATMKHAHKEDIFGVGGFPEGEEWTTIAFPDIRDPHVYALKVSDSELEPTYRSGDVLIISPNTSPRRGDRVIVKKRSGAMLTGLMHRQSTKKIDLAKLCTKEACCTVDLKEVKWIGRIIWVSQ